LDSDGLENSSEAEEESELCSVRKNSIDTFVICQTEANGIALYTREVSSGAFLKAPFWSC